MKGERQLKIKKRGTEQFALLTTYPKRPSEYTLARCVYHSWIGITEPNISVVTVGDFHLDNMSLSHPGKHFNVYDDKARAERYVSGDLTPYKEFIQHV